MKKWRVALAVTLVAAGLWSTPTTSAAPTAPTGVITDPKLLAEIAAATAQAQRIEATGARTATPTVSVEVLTTDVDSTKRLVRAYGGTITGDVPGALVQAEVPPAAAGLIAAGRTVDSMRSPMRAGRLPVPQTVVRPRAELGTGFYPDNPQTYGSASSWQSLGYTGSGIKVGIVDYFDFRSWRAAENGPVPDAAHQFCRDSTTSGAFSLCLGPNNINSANGSLHGVAVAEIIKDIAPGVELFVASVGTTSDLRSAIDWFAANGVSVMNRSLGSAYDGPGDGTGPIDAVVDHAASKGISWVNSAGNDGFGAYVRQTVAATDSAGYVNFASSGTDTWLRVDSEPGFCFFLDGVRWANDWYLPAAQRTDYRVEVYEPAPGFGPGAIGTLRNPTTSQVRPLNLNADGPQGGQGPGGNIIDASQRAGAAPLEAADVAICPNNAANQLNDPAFGGYAVTYLRVKRNLGTPIGPRPDTVEVAIAGNAYIERWTSGGSAAKPAVDSKNVALLAVGATELDLDLRAIDQGDQLAYYSSRGPTNDGRTKPDLVAPSGHYSVTYAQATAGQVTVFHGTSAAAPVVTGVAAELMDAELANSGQPLSALVLHNTNYRAEPDNLYGHGEIYPVTVPSGNGVNSAPSWYSPLDVPFRLIDTRTGVYGPAGVRRPHSITRVVDSFIPGRPTALAVNITVVGPIQPGYIQVLPLNRARVGAFSTLNVSTAGGVRPNFAVVPLGDGGAFEVYMPTGGHLVVDVLGAFYADLPTHASGRLQLLDVPERWAGQRTLTSQVESVVAPPPTSGITSALTAGHVDAVVVNITAEGATRAGDIKAYETGQTPGAHSNVNFGVIAPSTNLAIVPVDAMGQFTLKSNNVAGNTVNASVDVVGYMTSASAPSSEEGLFVPVPPTRVYRQYDASDATARPIAISGITPGEVLALSGNLTATRVIATGYVTMYDALQARPSTYNVTYSPGQTVANSAIFGVGWDPVTSASTTTAFVSTGADFIIDVNGYFLKAAPPP